MTTVKKSHFGQNKDGEDVANYCLKSDNVEVVLTEYGAAIVSLNIPDKNGEVDDIVTGFDDLEGYLKGSPYFGCVVGRVANRTGNGRFTLNGKIYTLCQNNGSNHLHGGKIGFDKKTWKSCQCENGVEFSLLSPDGEEGYPGTLTVKVTYTLLNNELQIKYEASSDKDTPINLTNHSYFNLGGHLEWKTVDEHSITVNANEYTPVDGGLLTTGEIRKVKGTNMDLTSPVLLTESRLNKIGKGFDHNYCLNRDGKRQLAARVIHTSNGRSMTVETTQPGVQLYTGNFLSGISGKRGITYEKHTAVCLETQNWPDAINKKDKFPNAVLEVGKKYDESTWFTFGVTK